MILGLGIGHQKGRRKANRALIYERNMMDIRMLYTNMAKMQKIIEGCPKCAKKLEKANLVSRSDCSSGLFKERFL